MTKPVIANAPQNLLGSKERENKYEISSYQIDLENDNSSHTILVKNALASKRILDVGCGVGYIGQKLLELQDCTVDGIEFDKKAASLAAKKYHQVSVMQLGNPADKEFQKFLKSRTQYDCIICGDILEHLVNPGYILSVLAKKLAPSGKILVSIPNISHFDVIAGLIDGKFNYAESGILDSTHLRLWTKSSFIEFIKNINQTFHLNLYPKHLASTHAESYIYSSASLKSVYGDDCTIFQNIFALTLENKPFPKVAHHKNYAKVSDLLMRTSTYQQALDAKDTHIHNLEQRLNSMEHSLSWKLTKPLRKISALAKR